MSVHSFQAVVIGTSAGGVDALSTILPYLPADYPLPIIIVVHLPPHKDSILAEILRLKCKVDVREAEDKEFIQASTVYIAPPGYHLQVEGDKSLSLSIEEERLFSRPSIDVLFETAADVYGANLIGIILTGANDDGAKGLKAIAQEKGITIVQTPSSANSSVMPESALKFCPEAKIMNLQEIASYLNTFSNIQVRHVI